jgi:hypothetical protein
MEGLKEPELLRRQAVSTLLYATITRTRAAEPPGDTFMDSTEKKDKDAKKTYIDALAALVPAEVLALHAFAIGYATKQENNVVTITQMGLLQLTFWAAIAISMLLYAIKRYRSGGGWDGLDWFRLAIPALAFVGWTMLQPTSAFDAVLDIPQGWRAVGAAILAIILGAAATKLAEKVDAEDPSSKKGEAKPAPARSAAPTPTRT